MLYHYNIILYILYYIYSIIYILYIHYNILYSYAILLYYIRLTGPDAYSVAIHDAVVQYGPMHREVSYHTWLRYRSVTDPNVNE